MNTPAYELGRAIGRGLVAVATVATVAAVGAGLYVAAYRALEFETVRVLLAALAASAAAVGACVAYDRVSAKGAGR